MKTQLEIARDARVMEDAVTQKWRRHAASLRGAGNASTALRYDLGQTSTVLPGLPTGHLLTSTQYVQVRAVGGRLHYTLNDHWEERPSADGPIERTRLFTPKESYVPQEIILQAYGSRENVRLMAALLPIERQARQGEANPFRVMIVAGMVDIEKFSPADRLRTYREIVDLIDGRLSLADFISNTVERHHQRETETMAQRYSQAVTHSP